MYNRYEVLLMEISERIKKRRKELGISPDAIADALNVSRATVYRYESNEIKKLPIATIEPLAKILKTTPAYLMGWEYDYSHLAPGEKQMVDLFRALNIDGQCKLIDYAKDLISSGRYTIEALYSTAVFNDSINMAAYDGDIEHNKIDIIEED